MNRFHSKRYHYPRWLLIKQTAAGFVWLLVGIGILLLPFRARWLGLLPVAYLCLRWHFKLRPMWQYVIRLDTEKLMIGSTDYPWNRFDQLNIEKNGSGRNLRLTGGKGALDVVIKDDLPDFDEVARSCFFYINRKHPPEQKKAKTEPSLPME